MGILCSIAEYNLEGYNLKGGTLLVTFKDQCSHLSSIGHRNWETIIMKQKAPLLDAFVCFQIGIKDF